MHGTGGSGICKYLDPFQMFGILKFKIRSRIHKKKSPFRFVPIFRDKTVRFSILVEISNRTRRNGYSDKNIKTLKKKGLCKKLQQQNQHNFKKKDSLPPLSPIDRLSRSTNQRK